MRKPALLILVIFLMASSCAPSGDPDGRAGSAALEHAEALPISPTRVQHGPMQRIELAIDHVRQRDLLTTHAFWTIFHGILGLGPATPLRDPLTDDRFPALEFVSAGNNVRGMEFIPTKHGLDVRTFAGGIGVGQGHQDQFIAEMAQHAIAPHHRFVVFGRDYEYLDFVRHAMMRARTTTDQELSWTIIVVSQYFGTDATWTNEHGERLSLEDLIRYEVDADVENAACGGTHRLFGLTWALQLHELRGGKRTGVWADVAKRLNHYRDHAKKHQLPEGPFSTNYFREPGNAPDRALRIGTTGHVLEWLSLWLTDEELRQPWMQEAANALALLILDSQGDSLEGGALYHAVHGLAMYYSRVYGTEFLGPNVPAFPRDVIGLAASPGASPK